MPCPPQLDTCCCCCTTETGTKIIGWLQTIFGIIGTLVAAYYLVTTINNLNKPVKIETPEFQIIVPESSTTAEEVAFAAVTLVGELLMAILGIYLLIGVNNLNMSYIRLWVVCSTVLLCVSLAIILIRIIMIIVEGVGALIFGEYIFGAVIFAIIEAYCILVVYSFYRDEEESSIS